MSEMSHIAELHSLPDVVGIGEIAKLAGVHRDRVAYAISRLRCDPLTRLGGVRAWRRRDVKRILEELDRISSHRRKP